MTPPGGPRRSDGGSRSVDVYVSQPGGDVLAGRAFLDVRRGRVSSMFRYDQSYLQRRGAFALDPALPLFEGAHAVADGLPYSFADCAPDRWGRNLIRKRAQALDAEAGRARHEVTEVDFLLGVSDLTRQGALRFADPGSGLAGRGATGNDAAGAGFLAPGSEVPRLIELPRLLDAAERVVRDDDPAAVKELLDAGTGSLGGTRPKASVRDGDRLLMAKFASPRDDWDVIAWEKTALDLAERAGIRVPARRLERMSGRSVLLVERFDRRPATARIPYVSAMTLLTSRDGDTSGFDYADLAEALVEHGASSVKHDLVELWRRTAFSVAIHNTDDHLRNHGFLRSGGGWALAPAFDINPNPDTGVPRELAIGAARSRDEMPDALRDAAARFGLDGDRAEGILGEVAAATADWKRVATGNGVPEAELRLMADAFEGFQI